MKIYKTILKLLLVSILIGLWLLATLKTAAKQPEIAVVEVAQAKTEELVPEAPKEPTAPNLPPKESHLSGGGVGKTAGDSTKHPIAASNPTNADNLKAYLEDINSPLAPYANSIADSDYWSMIIAVCWHEQHQCQSAPNWNYWGLKGTGDCGKSAAGFAKFCNAESAITEVKKRMVNYVARFGPNIEDWRGRYCVAAGGGICWQWEYTVIKQKAIIETKAKI